MSQMDPLRREHQELLPHVEELRLAAEAVDGGSLEALRRGVDDSLRFLTIHLIPHALAEERALYPVVGRLMGAERATATMSRDHAEVERLTQKLAVLRRQLAVPELTSALARDLRRVLYGLYALLRLHFRKEEDVYLPLLDERLTAAEAEGLFAAMEATAGQARTSALV